MSASGLNTAQLAWAKAVVAAVKAMRLPVDQGQRATDIALATVKVESDFRMYANRHNQASLNLPHDAVGSDHGSVGLFQQQVGGAYNSTANWGTTRECMNVTYSTQKFVTELLKVDWLHMTNGRAAQAVQNSARPDEYAKWDGWAISLRKELWAAAPAKPPYTVKSGDTLSAIADRFHVAGGYQALARFNHIADPDSITPGQVLRIP